MNDENVADTAAALEPTLIFGGSKAAVGAWLGLAGMFAGAFGGVTLSPAIRHTIPFVLYLVAAALLLRGLHPLTVRLFGAGAGWLTMFAFFWAAGLGLSAVLGARIDSTWIAYSMSIALGAFIGMMYGAFPPGAVRNGDAWMVSFLLAPLGCFIATYLLRRTPGVRDTLHGAIATGALAGGVMTVPMGVLLSRLWDEARGLSEMGLLHLHNDNFAAKAVAYFDRAIVLDPQNARYHSLRAVGLSRMNALARAAADWERAVELAPRDPEPHLHRGIEMLRHGAVPDAITALEAAIAKRPDFGAAHRYVGIGYERHGELTRAFEHYDRAIALARNDAGAYADRGAAHLRQGNHDRALSDVNRAIRLDARLSAAYVTRGHVLTKLNRLDDARLSYEEATDLEAAPAVHEDALRGLEALERATGK